MSERTENDGSNMHNNDYFLSNDDLMCDFSFIESTLNCDRLEVITNL